MPTRIGAGMIRCVFQGLILMDKAISGDTVCHVLWGIKELDQVYCIA